MRNRKIECGVKEGEVAAIDCTPKQKIAYPSSYESD